VGITRAKDRLHLVRAFRRSQFGTSGVTEPSRFLEDIPPDLIAGDFVGRRTRAEATYERQTRWEPRPTAPTARYRAGMRVQHPAFGEGIVLESRLANDDEEVTIEFGERGTKRLAASLARLTVLEG
ncbi:MAG TPA: hypothetical protein VJJ46_12215, partial [Anaerolineales bacterium]|nr:hypothetical protein [Anaerolineales bacterium]